MALAMPQADRWWADFPRVIGKPELAIDEKYNTMMNRGVNAAELIALLDEVFASRTHDEWTQALTKGGDFIFSYVNSVSDLPNDPRSRRTASSPTSSTIRSAR